MDRCAQVFASGTLFTLGSGISATSPVTQPGAGATFAATFSATPPTVGVSFTFGVAVYTQCGSALDSLGVAPVAVGNNPAGTPTGLLAPTNSLTTGGTGSGADRRHHRARAGRAPHLFPGTASAPERAHATVVIASPERIPWSNPAASRDAFCPEPTAPARTIRVPASFGRDPSLNARTPADPISAAAGHDSSLRPANCTATTCELSATGASWPGACHPSTAAPRCPSPSWHNAIVSAATATHHYIHGPTTPGHNSFAHPVTSDQHINTPAACERSTPLRAAAAAAAAARPSLVRFLLLQPLLCLWPSSLHTCRAQQWFADHLHCSTIIA